MNVEREKELILNPHLITHSEVRYLVYQNRHHTEVLMLRNQQIRLLKARLMDLINRVASRDRSQQWWNTLFRRTP